jgi:Fur family ferric uptake transcriptional regulator
MHVTADGLIEALREEGLRITVARRAICQVLADTHDDHLAAPDVLRRARGIAGQDINASTVYRTIEALEELGMVDHVHLGHGPGVIHFTDTTHHHHLVCRDCGAVIDIDWSELEPLVAAIGDRHGFEVGGAHFALEGRCKGCRESSSL